MILFCLLNSSNQSVNALNCIMLHGILYEKKSLGLGKLFKALLKAFVVNCLIVS